jgi:hypothetical protein
VQVLAQRLEGGAGGGGGGVDLDPVAGGHQGRLGHAGQAHQLVQVVLDLARDHRQALAHLDGGGLVGEPDDHQAPRHTAARMK